MNSSAIGNISDQLQSLFGADCVYNAAPADAVAGIHPQLVCEPTTEQELASILRFANEANLAVIPRGGGTKPDWGNPPDRADLILSTKRLNKIIEHAWADLTVTIEAGCTFHDLQLALAQHGQRLALDPLWPRNATIGGVLSTNDSGALRLHFGSLRDLIIGITIALSDGTLASSGGKVVKNVAGYDLPKLITGSLGTLGIITRAIFRVHPLPRSTKTFSCVAVDLPEIKRLLLAIQDSNLAHSALQVQFIANGPRSQIDILFEGSETGIAAQITQLKSIASSTSIVEADPLVWNARQELHSAAKRDHMNSALAKFSALPAKIVDVVDHLRTIAAIRVRCNSVIYPTGLGCVHLQGEPTEIVSVLSDFRSLLENSEGSLVILHKPATMPPLDAWGKPSDALPLMRALKQQFDPKRTLNPGRFVAGI